jgi:hypothetical protein
MRAVVVISLLFFIRTEAIVRANAGRWHLSPDRIGVQGSSAGGHLASLVATHTEDLAAIGDAFDAVSFRKWALSPGRHDNNHYAEVAP